MAEDDRFAARSRWTWPLWLCGAVRADTGRLCDQFARWQRKPTADAAWPWLYCDECRPPGAEPIPPDAPYYVTRLDVRIALTGAPGDRAAARDEAIRRVQCALEDAGALVLELHVVGGRATAARPGAAGLRLQLAGPREAVPGRSGLYEAPIAPAPWSRRRRRRTG